ncbi:hypothetical protein TIFTF001_030189 [Ficus carica]|uniref:Uncharacterized protein n=1 Tax=Ficus carica TaxID=3494 RepID=A0AA88DSY4_FICCA|nr:hypothetical protein TIFTF001_030189 [Ficus carica]
MDEVCVFVKYNGQGDGTLRYVGGEIKGILVPVTATYVGLIELVRSVIGIRDLDKTIVMRYAVELGMPPMSLRPKRCHRSNLIIFPSRPPHIPSPTVDLDLHTEDGIEKQHQLLNNDLCTDHDDYNAGELNVANAARHSNEKSIAASIGAHSIVITTRTQSVNVPSSDSLSSSVVVADFISVTMPRNCIF